MVRRLVIAMIILCCPAGAVADQQAGELLEQARQRMISADFSGALDLLTRAKTVAVPETPTGAVLAAQIELQLGVVFAVLGRTGDARRAFTAALRYDASVGLDPTKTKSSIHELFEATRRALQGELSITADLPDVEIWIDDRPVGKLPYRGRLTPGSHELRAAVLGQQVDARTVVVPVGRILSQHLALQHRCGTLLVRSTRDRAQVFFDGRRIGSTPLTRLVPEGEHEVIVATGRGRRRQQVSIEKGATVRISSGAVRPITRESRASGRRIWTWVTLAGAGISFAVALGFGSAARQHYSDYQALPSNQGDRGRELEARVKDNATKANVLFGVSGALLVTSAVVFFLEGWALAQRSRVSVAPVLGEAWGVLAHASF